MPATAYMLTRGYMFTCFETLILLLSSIFHKCQLKKRGLLTSRCQVDTKVKINEQRLLSIICKCSTCSVTQAHTQLKTQAYHTSRFPRHVLFLGPCPGGFSQIFNCLGFWITTPVTDQQRQWTWQLWTFKCHNQQQRHDIANIIYQQNHCFIPYHSICCFKHCHCNHFVHLCFLFHHTIGGNITGQCGVAIDNFCVLFLAWPNIVTLWKMRLTSTKLSVDSEQQDIYVTETYHRCQELADSVEEG